ncbi:hypothetical protein ANTPLA_LOCUS547 [Anthophora plagiata]
MKKISKKIDGSVTSAYSKVVKKASPTKDFALSMTAILMKITGLWLAKDKKEERRRLYTLIYTVIAILFGVWIQIRDFYYSWPNFSDCAYTACNILSLVMVFLKVTVIIVHKKKFIDLLEYTYKNFWHINYDYNELLLLKNCRTVSTRCLTLVTFCCQGTVVSYVIAPISTNIVNNGSDRVLPFNMWVNLPLAVSPWYELTFTAQADSPPAKRLIFIFHLFGSFCQLLLFTYSCDGLIEESTNVGTAIYCGPWLYLPMDKAGRMLRKDLTMVIIRSKKPCCLTASGFFPVSLETCTTVFDSSLL